MSRDTANNDTHSATEPPPPPPPVLQSSFSSPTISSSSLPNQGTYYFGFSSMLSPTALSTCCPHSHPIGLAHLSGWKWIIGPRGHANIVPISAPAAATYHANMKAAAPDSNNEDSTQMVDTDAMSALQPPAVIEGTIEGAGSPRDEDGVYGMLYQLTHDDEKVLDRWEGVGFAYRKFELDVEIVSTTPKTKNSEEGGMEKTSFAVTGLYKKLVGAKKPFVGGPCQTSGPSRSWMPPWGRSNQLPTKPREQEVPDDTTTVVGPIGPQGQPRTLLPPSTIAPVQHQEQEIGTSTHATAPSTIPPPLKAGDKVTALVYVDTWRQGTGKPRAEYVVRINAGMKEGREWGLPEGYVEGILRKWIPGPEVGFEEGGKWVRDG